MRTTDGSNGATQSSAPGGSGAAEGARRATGAEPLPPGRAAERGRWTSARKAQAVLRLLRGETLDALGRELGVNAGKLAAWRDAFLAAGQTSLKSRSGDADADERDQQIKRLQSKIGELTMDVELLNHKIDAMETHDPLALRRSKR